MKRPAAKKIKTGLPRWATGLLILFVMLCAATGCGQPAGKGSVSNTTGSVSPVPAAEDTAGDSSFVPPPDTLAINPPDAVSCYSYLTELVRSSNFPFRGFEPARINLLIDDDQDTAISAQLVYQTNGTGIMGWVRYDVASQTLYNTSADLDTPAKLAFARKWADDFARCRSKALGAQGQD